jgi:phospholipase D3/4
MPSSTKWPAFTRVNHAKYIVTDSRINVGTSNMEWGYFYNTAGASFNTDSSAALAQLQEIFDRNWNSPYAEPLQQF